MEAFIAHVQTSWPALRMMLAAKEIMDTLRNLQYSLENTIRHLAKALLLGQYMV